MIKQYSRALPACLLLLAASGDSLARTSTPKTYATDATRDIVGGRKVLVLMPPTGIVATYDDVNLGAVSLIGSVPLAIASKIAEVGINEGMAEKAELKIAPLRTALQGFEFEKPMQAALFPAIESSTWLRAQNVELSHDGSAENIERVLNDSNTRQMLNVHASYYADHRFRNLAVSVESSILVRRIPKGKYSNARLKPDYIPFRQTFRCIVYLPGSEHGSAESNLARWSANDGRFARQALDLGISRVGTLFARNLDATRESAAAWNKRGDRKTVTQSRLLGWVIERQGNSLLFFSPRDDALNYIELLAP